MKIVEKTRSGFTLIELLVVLVILGLMATLVGPRVLKHVGESKTQTAMLQIEQLGAALDMFMLEVGQYPTNEQGLVALVEPPPGVDDWNGPYLTKRVIRNDPWGNQYHYRTPGEHGSYDLYSLGADNAEGGEQEDQDVLAWE